MRGRLQFVHTSTPFNSRELAHKKINELTRDSLIGEPIVVTYYNNGIVDDVELIIAIGKGVDSNGKSLGYHVIDSKLINENNSEVSSAIEDLKVLIERETEERISTDSELTKMISDEESKRNEAFNNLLALVEKNTLTSTLSNTSSISSAIIVDESGTTLSFDVRIDNTSEFLKYDEDGLSDVGIKDFVNESIASSASELIGIIDENEEKSISADIELERKIDLEISNRTSSYNELSSEFNEKIDKEISDRVLSYNTLNSELTNKLDEEISKRGESDNILHLQIDSLSAITDAAIDDFYVHEGNKDIHITREERNAWNDSASKIDAFISSASFGDSVIDTLKELQEYIEGDETGAANMLASIEENSENISKEISDREAADSELRGLISDEAQNRGQAISSLNNELKMYIDSEDSSIKKHFNSLIGTGFTESSPISEQLFDVKETADSAAKKTYVDNELSLKATKSELASEVSNLMSLLTKEMTDRANADSGKVNNADFEAEKENRRLRESEILGIIAEETANRKKADNEISSGLSLEIANRISSVELIETKISQKADISGLSKEVEDRRVADGEIIGRIAVIEDTFVNEGDFNVLSTKVDAKLDKGIFDAKVEELSGIDSEMLESLSSLESLVGNDSVSTQIENAISKLDVADSYVDGMFVSEVDETNGVITVGRLPFSTITSSITESLEVIKTDITYLKDTVKVLETVDGELATKVEVNEFKSEVEQIIIENEKVVSEALNDLKSENNELKYENIELKTRLDKLESALKNILGVSDFSVANNIYAITNVVQGAGDEISVKTDKNTLTIDFNSEILGGIID